MNIELIHKNFPIWEITGWQVPYVDYTKVIPFDQSSKYYKNNELRQEVNLPIDMSQSIRIEEMLKESDLLILDQMWKGHLNRLVWPQGLEGASFDRSGNTNILLDKPGFNMGPHIDNRFVIGVLIINLQDNPIGSGTFFPELDYTGPIKKGTGIFFLNHINTEHKIYQPGPQDRLIAYQTLTLDNLHYD